MAINLWPADAVTGAPSYTGRALRQTAHGVVAGKTATRPLGGRTGVWPGTPNTTVSVSAPTITTAPHGGVLDVEANAAAGPYVYSIDANDTKTLTAADATNPRIDIISIQMDDPAEGDGTANPQARVVYTTGTAASSPVAPATPVRAFTIAQINVPKVGAGSPSVTWVAPYTSAAGGIIPVSGSAQYPATPYQGQYVDDATLGLVRYNGSTWTSQTDGLGEIASTTFSTDLVSSGLTEVVGYSQSVSVVTGRKYRVLVNAMLNAGAAGNIAGLRVRFATGAVTNTSTLAGQPQKITQSAAGSAGRQSYAFFAEFTAPSTGALNVALGVATVSGTGNTTVVGAADTPSVISIDCVA